jgi:hypothetical protein
MVFSVFENYKATGLIFSCNARIFVFSVHFGKKQETALNLAKKLEFLGDWTVRSSSLMDY